jgi:hypothetical protein
MSDQVKNSYFNHQEMNHQYNICFFKAGFQHFRLLILLQLILVTVPAILSAQGTMGSRVFSLGQSGTALTNDHWALFQNPSLMKTDDYAVSFYGMRFAGMEELTDLAFTLSLGSRIGTAGIGLHHFGFELYRETRFRIGYSNQIDLFHYGAALTYYHVEQGEGYGSAGAVGIDFGLAAQLGNRILFGAAATNLNRPAYGNSNEELYRALALGISYQMTDEILFLFDIVKDARFPASIRSGIETEIISGFCLRAGITTEPLTWSAGFGFKTGRVSVNIAVQNHDPLGISPAVDFGFGE